MAVTASLAEVHALVLEAPGAQGLRIAVDAALAAGGGVNALTPAAANALVVCGAVPERFDELVERLWEQLPYPRTRVEVAAEGEIAAALAGAVDRLRDLPAQRAAALRDERPAMDHAAMGHDMSGMSGMSGMDHAAMGHAMPAGAAPVDHAAMGHDMSGVSGDAPAVDHAAMGHAMPADAPGMDHAAMGHDMSGVSGDAPAVDHAAMGHDMSGMSGDAPGMDHAAMGHAMPAGAAPMDHAAMGHDMSGMSGHDHMSMAGPGGYPLAMGDDDRDGLEMDVLNRTLGPFLDDWDPRLILRVVLAGDTIRSAQAEIVPALADATRPAVARLDLIARVLDVAGWSALAARAARARDAALSARDVEALRETARVRAAAARSPILRWAVRGLRIGDFPVRDVILAALDAALALLRGEEAAAPPTLTASQIEELVTGRDLGTARLLLAAIVPDPAGAGPSAEEQTAPDAPSAHEGMSHGGMDHRGMDHGGMDHEGMDHGGMSNGGMSHEGMDHEGMRHG